MDARANAWMLPACACLLAAAGGVAAGWFLRGAQAAPPLLPAPQSAELATRAQLEELKRELLACFGDATHAPRTKGATNSAPLAPDAGTLLELGRKLDELGARVAVLSSGVRPVIGGRSWANARGPGSESIEKMIARIRESEHRDHAGEPGEDAIPTILREHSLWTVEDVVRVYGPPDRVDDRNGLAFRYGRFTIEGYGGEYFLYFRFREGFVVDFGFDGVSD